MMKTFYQEQLVETPGGPVPSVPSSYIRTRARVAVYDGLSSAPYVEDVSPSAPNHYIESLAARVYELARDRGGAIPFTVVREVAENLIHADFTEPIVSVLDGGRTIRFSDQGPGIPDKRKALEPGFTTATSDMKSVIRGVGSGLPIVREFLTLSGGSLVIEDNLSGGTVVTLRCGSSCEGSISEASSGRHGSVAGVEAGSAPASPSNMVQQCFTSPPHLDPRENIPLRLTTRQKHVLALVLETGSAGPSIVSKELGVGLSTAYRDLASLEDMGLIEADGGKRTLTSHGVAFLGSMTSSAE